MYITIFTFLCEHVYHILHIYQIKYHISYMKKNEIYHKLQKYTQDIYINNMSYSIDYMLHIEYRILQIEKYMYHISNTKNYYMYISYILYHVLYTKCCTLYGILHIIYHISLSKNTNIIYQI